MSNVVRIEDGTSPLQEYRARAADIPAGDAEAWRELAQWAKGYSLASQALNAYTQVVEILPDDEEANKALGRVKLNGQWVSEEDAYRAKGYVYFEGAWMTPTEQQSIIATRQAKKQADEKANEAAIQAIDAEAAAKKKKQDEDREAEERYRNPVSWGWGYGPGYWHAPAQGGYYR